MSPTRSGYPLGALFVLVAASAVLAAGATPVVRLVMAGREELGTLLGAVGIGAGCGLLVGLVIGLLQFRRALGAAMGVLAGIVIGGSGGAISLLPSNQITAVAAAMTAGSALIVGVALIMRRTED